MRTAVAAQEEVGASRLTRANAIISGLSSEIAQTLVTTGVDPTGMNTVGDLQGGVEEAERTFGFRVTRNLDARR
jgi:rsbT co-antagonist protein RsbR